VAPTQIATTNWQRAKQHTAGTPRLGISIAPANSRWA
jgi:hypothetical protein